MVGWGYLLFQPLVAPLLFLIFAWVVDDVWTADENGLGIGTSLWWLWVIIAAGIVFFLTYRDIRLSTNAGIVLGIIEIGVFVALAVWILLSNLGDFTLQTFNPSNNEVGTLEGTFKGMVFAILAFIGFESAAPLGEEARRPRWTIPRAVVGSALVIGLFYVLCSYAWVIGTGFGQFTEVTTAAANPWRDLGEVFWGAGWVLVFFAIVNSRRSGPRRKPLLRPPRGGRHGHARRDGRRRDLLHGRRDRRRGHRPLRRAEGQAGPLGP